MGNVAAPQSPRVLVADDQPDVVEALRLLLKSEGFTIRVASSPRAILESVAQVEHDVVLMDLNYARDTTSGREGFEVLERLREIDTTLPVVVMTAWGSIDGAVDAVRRGARDYVQKPWDSARLVATLRNEVEFGGVLRRSRRLENEASRQRAQHLPRLIAGAPSDEIGNLPIAQQVKLLRVLQTGEFLPVGSPRARRADVRVLAATNVDIAREVTEGRFREDLLYRLNTVELQVPPLRERREDIPTLAAHFLERLAQRYAKPARAVSAAAMSALLDHAWPGNVRELEHVVERALLMSRGEAIAPEDLGLRPRASAPPDLDRLTLEQVEYHAIRRAITRAHGSVSDAAVALGLSRSALYRRLQHHGIKGAG